MKKVNYLKLSAALVVACSAHMAWAQEAPAQVAAPAQGNCDNYDYQAGDSEVVFEEGGKFKIISTAAASVSFDKPNVLMMARRNAEMQAKAMLAEYVNQRLSTEDSINQEMAQSSSLKKLADGSAEEQASLDEAMKQARSIAGRADAVLRGVLPLGSCYTKGSEVRVTVGIKSDTVANATQLGETMGVNAAQAYGTETAQPAATAAQDKAAPAAPAATAKEGETRSYSGGQLIKKF